MFDLGAFLPMAIFDRITDVRNFGAIARTCRLTCLDAPSGNTKLSVSLGGGSFSQFMGGLSANVSFKRWYFSATSFGQYGADNFRYITATGGHIQMLQGLHTIYLLTLLLLSNSLEGVDFSDFSSFPRPSLNKKKQIFIITAYLLSF